MAQAIIHDDLFSMLGMELPWSASKLREMLAQNPDSADQIGAEIERCSFAELELVLTQPIVDPSDGGAPLVAGNVRLTPRKFQSLLNRQAHNMAAPIGPFVIEPSEEALRHYRKKIANRFNELVERIRGGNKDNARTVHQAIANTPEMACIEGYFGSLTEDVFSSPQNLPRVLPVIADTENDSVLLNSINAAFVAMAVRYCYQPFQDAGERKDALTQVGMAGLLQDFSRMLEPGLPEPDHPNASADWAGESGAPSAVVNLIRLHHTLVDSEGTPLLKGKETVPIPLRVLMATNVFLGEIRGKGPGQNFESVKSLSYLAEMQMVDRRAVQIISRLYLPKLKAAVIDKAAQLAKDCPHEEGNPILWPITGDKIPSVYLCNSDQCEHRTEQVSQLATDIPFEIDGQTLSTIEKGTYFTCPFLTARLKALYAAIKSQVKK